MGTLAQHQQQNDPNYRGCYKKSQGYRVSQAPGGGSSISLSWGGDDRGSDTSVVGQGRGQRAASPSHGAGLGCIGGQREAAGSRASAVGSSQRDASPFGAAGRAVQREASPFAGGARGGARSASPFARVPSPQNG